jgi:O-antigen/teichoic acid export membrane protein
VVKEGALYVFFNYLSVFINALRGILLIGLLKPASLGVYRLIFTYTSYFRYYNLGLNALAFYRAPAKNMREIYAYIIYKINLSLAISFGFVFAAVFALTMRGQLSEYLQIDTLLALFLILVFTQLGETVVTILKIYGRFSVINGYNIFTGIVSFILTVALSYYFGLTGAIWSLSFSAVITYWYIARQLRKVPSHKINFTRRKIVVLFKHGIINILPGMLSVLFGTVEIWLIGYKYNIQETGYYSVVVTLINLILMVNTDGLVFLYSKKAARIKSEPKFLMRVTVISFVLLSATCFVAIFVVDIATKMFFKNYIPSSEIYKICFWGIPFLCFKNIVFYYISNNKPMIVSVLLAILVIIKVSVLIFIDSKPDFYSMVAVFNFLYGIALIIFFTKDSAWYRIRQATEIAKL